MLDYQAAPFFEVNNTALHNISRTVFLSNTDRLAGLLPSADLVGL
ncbi:hypothetical protein GGQ19_000078 [Salinibacter ruber]|nr:hypothetical protein [Salinibacter ruber]